MTVKKIYPQRGWLLHSEFKLHVCVTWDAEMYNLHQRSAMLIYDKWELSQRTVRGLVDCKILISS